jgi:putative tryptophan/tyrosine transport system substrate-binding protein
MRRREFILAGAALVAPFAVEAQQKRVRKVGFLGANTPATSGHWATAFVERLKELGWVEGQSLVIEYRWAGGQTAKFKEFAAELVAAGVEVIVTSGDAAVRAARDAGGAGLPIVMAASANPIGFGLIESLPRPGGSVTGLTSIHDDTVGKRLQLLRQIIPGLRRVFVLKNPDASQTELKLLNEDAAKLGVGTELVAFRKPADLEPMTWHPERAAIGAMMVLSDPLVFTHRIAINAFALRERLPTMHVWEEYARDGGLVAYGPNWILHFRRAAEFVDKILKGAKPADLPVERPTKFKLTINLKTAAALGLTFPDHVLGVADEVIEP